MGFGLSPVRGFYCQAQRLANVFTEYLRLARILWDQILVALAGNGGGRARGDEAGFQSDWGILTAQHDKRGGGNEGRI